MNARIEAAATALIRMFEMQSPRAVSLSPLAMAEAAIAAADAVDPLRPPAGDNGIYLTGKATIVNREFRTVRTHKQFNELPSLTRLMTADGLVGVVNRGGITALIDDLTCEWHALEDLTLPLSVIHVPTPDVSE